MNRAEATATQRLLQATRGVPLPRQAENAAKFLARASHDVLGEGMTALDVIEHVDAPYTPPPTAHDDRRPPRRQPIRWTRKQRKGTR